MTKEDLERQLEWTDELKRTKALGADLTDFYYQSRKEELLAAYEMSKRPKSYEEMKAQIIMIQEKREKSFALLPGNFL